MLERKRQHTDAGPYGSIAQEIVDNEVRDKDPVFTLEEYQRIFGVCALEKGFSTPSLPA